MPRLPDSFGQVTGLGERPSPRPSYRVADVEGTAPGRSQAHLGDTMMSIGSEFQQLYDRQVERIDTQRAEDALNQLRAKELDLAHGENGFTKVTGANAVTRPIAKEYLDQRSQAVSQIGETLSSPRQKELFQARAAATSIQYQTALLTHVQKQTGVYQDDVFENTRALGIRDISENYQNDGAFATSITRFNKAADENAAREGGSPQSAEIAKSKFLDSAWKARLEAWSLNDRVGALAAWQKNQNEISPALRSHLGSTLFHAAKEPLAAGLNAQGGPDIPINETVPAPKSEASRGPLPRGVRNNNPLNIIQSGTRWQGEVEGGDPRFASFATPEDGIRAGAKNLLTYGEKYGLNTVDAIISRWAPATENDTQKYIKTVSRELGVKSDEVLNLRDSETLTKLATAIIRVENGKQPYSAQAIRTSVAAALTGGPVQVADASGAVAIPLPQEALVTGTSLGADRTNYANVTPTQALTLKTGNAIIDQLPADWKLEVLHLARTQAHQEMALARGQLTGKMKDFEAMAVNGVQIPQASIPTENELINAFGQLEGASKYRSTVPPLISLNSDIQRVGGLSRTAQDALVSTRTPTPGEGFAANASIQNTLVSAINTVRKQQDDDPGGFVVQSAPTVKRAWDQTQQALQSKDPRAIQFAFEDFAAASIAEQDRLGMPKQAILPKALADSIVDSFNSKADGGQNAAQVVSQLAGQWGKYWPQVYSEVQKRIPGSAVVIGSGLDPNSAAAGLLVRAGNMSDKELKEGLPADIPSDIKKALPEKLHDFRLSLAQTVGGNELFNTFSDQTEKLALMYARQGKKAKDAVQQAYDDTIGKRYDFISSRGSVYMVPKAFDSNQIERGANEFMKTIDKLDLEIPQKQGLDEAQRKTAYISALKDQAYFVNAPGDFGLTLYANGSAVLDKKGLPITRPFSFFSLSALPPGKGVQPATPPALPGETSAGAVTGRARKR